MNQLNQAKRVQIIAALVEGNSMRAAARMADVAFNTVLKLLPEIGAACEDYQRRVFRNLPCKRIECDEIWQFCYAKAKNVPADKQGQFGYGDVWTWVALCADTKLVPTWAIGGRDTMTAVAFMHDLAGRLAHRIQLTTDGHRVYLDAVESAFGSEIDYSMLVKMYGNDSGSDESRYSPADCTGTRKIRVIGHPKPHHVSTSYVERQNLTMRMKMRRFTRLTNAFSKKVDNLRWSVALHFMHYNFCRVHQNLRVTPAMEAGVSDHVWTMEELVSLLDRPATIAA
jgi:IS1 family transposase